MWNERWVDAASPATAPRGLRMFFRVALACVCVALLSACAYRSFGPWLGAERQGSPWMNAIAAIAFIVSVLFAAIFWLLEVSYNRVRVMPALIRLLASIVDSVGPVLLFLVVVAGLVVVIQAFLEFGHQFGYLVTALAFVVVGVPLLRVSIVIERRSARMSNPFRKYFEYSDEELLRQRLMKESGFGTHLAMSAQRSESS